jgi:hypothetical protein
MAWTLASASRKMAIKIFNRCFTQLGEGNALPIAPKSEVFHNSDMFLRS